MNNIEWQTASDLIDYNDAIAFMEQRVKDIFDGNAAQLIWLLEHPPIYTMGTSGKENDIISRGEIPILQTGRGGKITYHGPGQRVVYIMLDIRKHGLDIRAFVKKIENWIIAALSTLNICAKIHDGRIGVWVDTLQNDGTIKEEKIAAIGLRIRRHISFHGMAINLAPNLDNFNNIIPCGLSPDDYGVTSINKLNKNFTMQDLDNALKSTFEQTFYSV